MLHRSFKPAKCKTALKLAVSRIKLMKNKMAAHQVQLRREVAQLLASGQERTARIRVEHVIREEKTVAAYDLLEVYCELIVARLPMIESQKNCPIDLKEAVTSVIFASQRCADLPELQEIRKHLQSKYGKEFSTAAIELRPGCGVSRLMIEKLSVAAPDAQSKTKILSAIALEHSVAWDPKTSGENEEKPPQDLLNGPNNFLSASQKYEEPPVQAPIVDTHKHDAYLHEKPSSPPVSQHFVSSVTPGTYLSQQCTENVTAEGMDMEHRNGNHKNFAAGKQNWNMEFTDATSAAHAAAEAAELASIAARAAVQLSNDERIARQQLSESQTRRLPVNDVRNASIDNLTVSTKNNANLTTDSANKFEHGVDSRMETDNLSMKSSRKPHHLHDDAYQNEGLGTFSRKSQMPPDPVYGNEDSGTNSKFDTSHRGNHFGKESERNSHDNLKVQGTNTNEKGDHTIVNEQFNQPNLVRGSSQSDSSKSKASFHGDEMFQNSYSQENIFSHSGQPVEHENNIAGKGGLEKCDSHSADEILHKLSNGGSSRSHSSRLKDDYEDCFLDKIDDSEHGSFQAQSTETAVFDDSDSDDDVHKIDFTEYPDLLRSLDKRSPKRSSWFANDTSYDEFVSKPAFANDESSSTKLFNDPSDIVGSSRSNESLSVAFDQSDSEDELEGSNHVVLSTHESLSRHTGLGTGSSNYECVTSFSMTDEDEPQHHVSSHSAFSDEHSKSTRESPYTRQDETSIEQPSLDTGKELNLGLLRGGLRNKGKKSPFYFTSSNVTSNPSDEVPVNDTLVSPNRTFADFVSSATQRPRGLQPYRETYGAASLSAMEPQTTDLEERSEVPKVTRPIPRISASEVKRRANKPSNEQLESSSNSPKLSTGTSSSSKLKAAQTRQDSVKKVSHVHPKLPDFDTLAAHFSSLREDSK